MNGEQRRIRIEGYCQPRFSLVRDVFRSNFARRHEHGAAFAAVVDGETVVDLWGGWADAGCTRRWEQDTVVTTQSTAKGILASLLFWLAGHGKLDWDAPVARYWPGFGQHGKEAVTVRQLASHQAGLCALDRELPAGATLCWPTMIAALEAQPPLWRPGERFGYHPVTWGFLIAELVHRVSGSYPPGLFAEVFAGPWRLDYQLGLARGDNPFGSRPVRDAARVAELLPPLPGDPPTPGFLPTPFAQRAFRVCPPAPGAGPNSTAVRAAPGNGFGDARSLARFYGGLAAGGTLDGMRVLSSDGTHGMGIAEVSGVDAVLGIKRSFGRGYWLHLPTPRGLRGPRAFGHPGLGGSFGAADPDRGLGLGYVMNRPGAYLRAAHLEIAVYRCL